MRSTSGMLSLCVQRDVAFAFIAPQVRVQFGVNL
jgi:hypothetical protein